MKRKVNIVLLLLVALLAPQFLLAQRNLEKGKQYFDLNQYQKAIPYFIKESNSDDMGVRKEATLKLADCYRLLGDFENAEKIYKKYIAKGGGKDAILQYGLALKAAAKYKEAKQEFLRYSKLAPEDPRGLMYARSCDFAQRMLDAEPEYEVREMKALNTKNADISPIYYKNGILFSSQREGGKKPFLNFEGGSGEVMLDLYFMEFDGKEQSLGNKIYFFPSLNTNEHEGPACFTADGTEIYFTRTVDGDRLNKSDKVVTNTLQVFHSQLQKDSTWSVPESAFPFNSIEYSVLHPWISEDKKRIFFASNMPGGIGGTDIYTCYLLKNGQWSKPYNLGPEVNSTENELYPFYDNDGHLYFSSNGHPGMGKLDIFRSTYDSLYGWSFVENMKVPVNSIGDDICYVESRESGRGMLVSDRINGTGGDDLYTFTKKMPIAVELVNDMLRIKNTNAYDALNYTVKVEGEKSSQPLEEQDGYFVFQPESGKSYVITARKEGFMYNSFTFSMERNADGSREVHMQPKMFDVELTGFVGVLPDNESIDTTLAEEARGASFFAKVKNKILPLPVVYTEYPLKKLFEEKSTADSRKKGYAGIKANHFIDDEFAEQLKTDRNGQFYFDVVAGQKNSIQIDAVPDGYKPVGKDELAEPEKKENIIDSMQNEGSNKELAKEELPEKIDASEKLSSVDSAGTNSKKESLTDKSQEKSVSKDVIQDIASKSNIELGWKKDGDVIESSFVAVANGQVLKNTSFILKDEDKVIGEVRSDSNGIVTLKNLSPDQVYSLQPTNSPQSKPLSFSPMQELQKQDKQLSMNVPAGTEKDQVAASNNTAGTSNQVNGQEKVEPTKADVSAVAGSKSTAGLGWRKDGNVIQSSFVAMANGQVLKNTSFILKDEDKVIGEVRSDSNGIVTLKNLSPDQVYSLQPTNSPQSKPLSFSPMQELQKQDKQLAMNVPAGKVIISGKDLVYDKVEVKEIEVKIPEENSAQVVQGGTDGASKQEVVQEYVEGTINIRKGAQLAVNTKIRFVASDGQVIEYTTDGVGDVDVRLRKNEKYTVEFPGDQAFNKIAFAAGDAAAMNAPLVFSKKDNQVATGNTSPDQGNQISRDANNNNASLINGGNTQLETIADPSVKKQSGLTVSGQVLSGVLEIMKGNQLAANTKVTFIPAQGQPVTYTTDAQGKISVNLDKRQKYTVRFPGDSSYVQNNFIPSELIGENIPVILSPVSGASGKLHYSLVNDSREVMGGKHFLIFDKGTVTSLLKTDAKGKLPRGISFSSKAKLALQVDGLIYVQLVSSMLVNDSILVFRTDKNLKDEVLPDKEKQLLLNEYMEDLALQTKVDPTQTKVVVRIVNQEIIASKLTLKEGTVVIKQLPIVNNMIGFGVIKDKKYGIAINAENYEPYSYSFEPNSELKGGVIVIKAALKPLVKEQVKAKKIMPVDSAVVVQNQIANQKSEEKKELTGLESAKSQLSNEVKSNTDTTAKTQSSGESKMDVKTAAVNEISQEQKVAASEVQAGRGNVVGSDMNQQTKENAVNGAVSSEIKEEGNATAGISTIRKGLVTNGEKISGTVQLRNANGPLANTKVVFTPVGGGKAVELISDANGNVQVDLKNGEMYTMSFPQNTQLAASTFVPSLYKANNPTCTINSKLSGVSQSSKMRYNLIYSNKTPVANKRYIIVDNGQFGELQKSDAKGKMPKDFSFGPKAKIILQDKGVLYVKVLSSILSSDSILTLNLGENSKAGQEVPEELSALLLNDYAEEVVGETKLTPGQTKVLVRIMNQEIIPSKLILKEAGLIKKELPVVNNMVGFGAMKDIQYEVIIKAENYKEYHYAFEPKAELKGATIVIKANLQPVIKEVAKVKKTMPVDSSAKNINTQDAAGEKMVVDGVVQEAKSDAPRTIINAERKADALGWKEIAGQKISARVIVAGVASDNKVQSFILTDEQGKTTNVQSDSNGMISLNGLDPQAIYTLSSQDNKNVEPLAFNADQEMKKNSSQLLFTKKGVALAKVNLLDPIEYDKVKVEELFLVIPEGEPGSKKVIVQVYFNGKPCSETNVEIFSNGKLQSLVQTDKDGLFVAYMKKESKNALEVAYNDFSYTVPLTAKDFVERKEYLEVNVNIDNLSPQNNKSPLSVSQDRISGPLQIMKNNKPAANTKVRFVSAQGVAVEYVTDADGNASVNLDKSAVYSVEFPEDLSYQKGTFAPMAHISADVPLVMKPYNDLVSKEGQNYFLLDPLGKPISNKDFIVMDHDGTSAVLKTDDRGRLPLGMRFSQNARIVLQENGVVFSKPLSSLLSSDSTMVFNSEAPAGKAEISADVAEKILDEYAREIQNEIKVEANQTKILVRVLNQEIIPAKLLVNEGAVVVKELRLENNMKGFGLQNDKKYSIAINAENYKPYNYTFEPKSIASNGQIVIKVRLYTLNSNQEMELSGVITSSNVPLTDVKVRLFEEGETYGRMRTAEDGKYSFKLGGQNIYTILVAKEGYETKQFSFTPEQLIKAKGSLSVNLDLEKREMLTVIGQVLDSNKPVSNANVQVYDADSVVARTSTDTTGFYEVSLREQNNYMISVTKEGYFQNNFNLNTPAKAEQPELRLKNAAKMAKIENNRLIQIPNIYFAYKSTKLSERSIVELDRLVMFLEMNPQIKILEIHAHSDEIGSNEYNLRLSKQRAQAVVAYLINEGISSKKLVAKGFGEEMPLIKNAKTDAEHEKNRRTEFKVILQ
ncbi:MAG: OmpA family protein [Flavobacteriales bacterium]